MSDGVSRLSMMNHAKCCCGGGKKESIEANDIRDKKEHVNPRCDTFTTL